MATTPMASWINLELGDSGISRAGRDLSLRSRLWKANLRPSVVDVQPLLPPQSARQVQRFLWRMPVLEESDSAPLHWHVRRWKPQRTESSARVLIRTALAQSWSSQDQAYKAHMSN